MLRPKTIRSYDYVNHPYARVREVLVRDALAVFHSATRSASSRAHDVASALRIKFAGLAIEKDIVIAIKSIGERKGTGRGAPVTHIEFAWRAAESPRLFPLMNATLDVYALTASETQLDLSGHYRPPLGALGKVINKVVGHRIAEASVRQFLVDVADYLRRTLRR